MRKIVFLLFVLLETLNLFGSVSLTFGADSTEAEKQSICPPGQFLVTIHTMSTCVSLEFKDSIQELHRKPSRPGGIFLNISGSSERNRMCLRCHIKGKPPRA